MTSLKKVHVGLNVNDVDRSVEFYRAMFGVRPAKWKPGYAKFDIAEPPLNLALNQGKVKDRGALNHLGVEVSSTAEVLSAKERLQKAGLETLEEMNVDCCFALQDKLWIADPDGNRWEIFTVKVADTRPELHATADTPGACCPPACCQP
jgi:catechol 2,3-dioxygenase-like lactoylglutathione lyase family enzyme